MLRQRVLFVESHHIGFSNQRNTGGGLAEFLFGADAEIVDLIALIAVGDGEIYLRIELGEGRNTA